MNTVAAREAKNRFGEILDRALSGETFAITRNGRVVAIVKPPSALRDEPETDGLIAEPAPYRFPKHVQAAAQALLDGPTPEYTSDDEADWANRLTRQVEGSE